MFLTYSGKKKNSLGVGEIWIFFSSGIIHRDADGGREVYISSKDLTLANFDSNNMENKSYFQLSTGKNVEVSHKFCEKLIFFTLTINQYYEKISFGTFSILAIYLDFKKFSSYCSIKNLIIWISSKFSRYSSLKNSDRYVEKVKDTIVWICQESCKKFDPILVRSSKNMNSRKYSKPDIISILGNQLDYFLIKLWTFPFHIKSFGVEINQKNKNFKSFSVFVSKIGIAVRFFSEQKIDFLNKSNQAYPWFEYSIKKNQKVKIFAKNWINSYNNSLNLNMATENFNLEKLTENSLVKFLFILRQKFLGNIMVFDQFLQ